MTLRYRLIVVLLVVLLVSALFTWFGVRPSYEKALVDERITLISEYQQQRIGEASIRFGHWLRISNELAQVLRSNPLQLESAANAYIRLFPELKAIRITEVRSGEFIQVNASGSQILPSFMDIREQAFDFKTDEALKGVWLPQDSLFYVLSEFSMGRDPFRLLVKFDATSLQENLIRNVLGSGSYSAIWLPDGRSYPDSLPAAMRPDAGSATLITEIESDGKRYIGMASPLGAVPVQHMVYADVDLVTAPVRDLFIQTLMLLAIVFLVLSIGAWVVSDLIRRPLDHFLEDVRPFADYQFDVSFRASSLPELATLTEQMELIRLKLRHYQRINVEQIIMQEQRNRLFMSHSSVMVAHFDENGQWLFRNDAILALMSQIQPDTDIPSLNAWLESDFTSIQQEQSSSVVREPVRIENRMMDLDIVTPDDTHYVLKGHIMETYASDGAHMGGFMLLNDVTQEREIDRMRTEMIHIIVHELQNPVAAVKGFLEILQEEEMSDEELKEIYGLCTRSVETLRNLIDRFLAITRLESGKEQIELEPVFMSETLSYVVDSFRPQLKGKQLDIQLNLAEVPVILGSNSMLEDVARNLISNAIKYGDSNRTIEVDLSMEGDSVVFSVTDHGFGIPEEHRDKMFQKFYRINAYKKQKGNGLGLAYVKEVVIKHNGTISFESNPDIGTRFIVRLPMQLEEV